MVTSIVNTEVVIPPEVSEQMQDSSTTPSVTPLVVERVQTGVRMEKRMVKVLKALAEYQDMSLGDLLEGIVLHAFANRLPFAPETLQRIDQLKDVYGMA